MDLNWVMGAAVGLSAALIWAVFDFRRWVALGVGGVPHTPRGWLVMSFLRMLKRDGVKAKQLKRQIDASDDHAYLGRIVRRAGSRPLVPSYSIPQRQLTDTISPTNLSKLKAVFDAKVQAHADTLHYKQSFYEKHNAAITMCHPDCGHAHGLISHGEVAHIHPVDGSMHMILSPSDAAKTIEAGWGELHGLAGFMDKLPVSYTFVYAPRNEQEIAVVQQLLDASVAHMTLRHAHKSKG